MAVEVADAHAHVQRLGSVVRMVIEHEKCTTEERCSVLRFLWGKKNTMRRILTKKCFLLTVGCVCRIKRFTADSRNSFSDVRKSQMMPDQLREWPRQQSRDFYAVGFDAVVKRRDKCVSVGGGHVEKYVSRYISICDLFTDSLVPLVLRIRILPTGPVCTVFCS
jgi:hypothetical protein